MYHVNAVDLDHQQSEAGEIGCHPLFQRGAGGGSISLITLRSAGKSVIGASVRLDLVHYRLQAQGVGVGHINNCTANVGLLQQGGCSLERASMESPRASRA